MDERETATRSQRADDEEPSADLSKAAREAVRQPPDPRIEGLFANLGEAPAVPIRQARADRPAAAAPSQQTPAAASIDVATLSAAVEAWQATAERVARRLEIATSVLVALTVVLAIAVVILVAGR